MLLELSAKQLKDRWGISIFMFVPPSKNTIKIRFVRLITVFPLDRGQL